MAKSENKDVWDKLGTLSALIASVLVPIVIVFVGNSYTSEMKHSEIRVKYLELAIGILKTSPSKDTEDIRKWAVKVIDNYSELPMDEKTKNELLRKQLTQAAEGFVGAVPHVP